MDGKKMSFAARIVDDASHPLRNDIDGNRHFVLTFYVVDGTLGIYEPMQKNSGLAGRKYLERMRVKKPTTTPLYYQMQVECPRQIFMLLPGLGDSCRQSKPAGLEKRGGP
jgi:hypothetical protein